MARILVQTDRGTMTLSEHIEPSNLAEDEYAHGLTDRIRWALSDADQAESVESGPHGPREHEG